MTIRLNVGARLVHTLAAAGFPFTVATQGRVVPAGVAQHLFSVQEIAAGRRIRGRATLEANATTLSVGNLTSWGGGGNAVSESFDNETGVEPALVVFTSPTACKVFNRGNSAGVVIDTTNGLPADFAAADTLAFGALYIDGAWQSAVTVVHFAEMVAWTAALSDAQAGAYLANTPFETIRPLDLYDGWTGNIPGTPGTAVTGALTGLVNGWLLTIVGSAEISSVAHPVTRASVVITGPTGAAGAASITHSVNELQNNAGTWSATGGSAWSLSGTDASLLSISSGGVVTLASGNFDRETKASYSFNVLRDAVAQAVTLNINNVNEAPTFSGPDISVPGLVVGTAMGSINAALLFADPDSGDTGAYSAVGTWPAGITVSSAGLISGTPSAAGTFGSLRVRRTDGGALTADSNLFTITVSASSTPVSFSGTVGAQSGTVGTAFSWAGSALASFFSGSLTPFTYNVSAGSLPPGLTLNASTGVVTGTPTTAGTFNATFRALDTGSNAATSNSVAFTIAAAPSAAGFDFHTAAGCIFGAISGSLVGLAREVGVSITTRVYNATTGALVATLPATATDSAGRLPRLTDAALSAGTTYRLVFVWPDGAGYTITMAAT